MAATPADRSMAARVANATRWSKVEDRTAETAPARRGMDARFAREIDPEGRLPLAELELRIASARKAHMLRMALKSAKARRARSAKGRPVTGRATAPGRAAGTSSPVEGPAAP